MTSSIASCPPSLGGSTWDVTIFSGNNVWGSENYSDGADGGLVSYLNSGGVNPFSDANGVLSITATPDAPGSTSDYTTGLIDNRNSFSQSYGYFEMRAELPAGAGFWPGFWMLPTVDNNDGVPEIDAMEAFGSDYEGEGGSNQVHYDLHSGTNPDTRGTWATINANIYTSYNTYGVMWTPTALTFYFDGQSIGSLPTSSDLIGNPGEYLIASLLTGAPGDWPGPMAGETGSLKIDYIRAFSSDVSVPAVALQTVSSPDGGGYNLYGATTAGSTTPKQTPTVTIKPSNGTSVTVSVERHGFVFGRYVQPDGARLDCRRARVHTANYLIRQHHGVTVTGGSALDTIDVSGGTNSFTAGAGGLDITASGGTNTFNILSGAGEMAITGFTTSDIIAAPVSLEGHIKETTVSGGIMLDIGSRHSAVQAIYLAGVSQFSVSAIAYH